MSVQQRVLKIFIGLDLDFVPTDQPANQLMQSDTCLCPLFTKKNNYEQIMKNTSHIYRLNQRSSQ